MEVLCIFFKVFFFIVSCVGWVGCGCFVLCFLVNLLLYLLIIGNRSDINDTIVSNKYLSRYDWWNDVIGFNVKLNAYL